jgi:hypothetical protein
VRRRQPKVLFPVARSKEAGCRLPVSGRPRLLSRSILASIKAPRCGSAALGTSPKAASQRRTAPRILVHAFYLFLGIVWDRGGARSKALLTLLFVLAVEVFQLTMVPLRFSQSDRFFLRLASILLGTQFAWWDIVAYRVGIAGV